MRRFATIALSTLALVLLTSLPPATAQMPRTETYSWSFARLGSNQVVCKKIDTVLDKAQPRTQDKQAVHINSTIVSDRYCAKLVKPAG
ncbi:MAG: hypothetical protein AB4352_22415 [Hormoscilla sp.]